MVDVPTPTLLNPKEIKIVDRKGKEHIYILSEIPATHSREIVAQYPTSALPKVGDYELNQRMMFKMLSYVAVPVNGGKATQCLVTRELIDNHIPDLQTLSRVEIEMARHNWDFFLPEDLSSFWGRIKTIVSAFIQETLTDSLRQSLQTEKPPSTNSAPPTA